MSRLALSFAVVAVLCPLARADEFDQVRQREELLAQKWNRDVAAALDVSRRQERTDPAGAREIINSALSQLKAAPGLSEAVRTDLTRRLQARLAAIQAAAAQPKSITPPRPAGYPPVVGGGTTIPPTFSSKSPPAGGVADTARSFIDKQSGSLSKANETANNRAAGFSSAISGIQNSSVPPDRDVSFSPNHKEIAARRAPAVNPKEEAVMTALATTIDGDFTGKNFRQALEYITQKTGLVIIPEAASLKEANVEYDDPVNFRIGAKISVRTALRKILADRGLSYTINEGTLNVVTVARARESTVIRIYPIRDLVTPIIPQPQYVIGAYGQLMPVAPNTFPPGTPGVTPSFTTVMGQSIADALRTSVDPQYFGPQGPGSVTFHEATGTLIVRASAEVQFMVNGALNRR
jgi:hypothetical protein